MLKNSTSIAAKLDGFVGSITLINPAKRNALTQDSWLGLPKAMNNLVKKGARVVVLSGAGSDFCAGADISEFDEVRKDAETAQIYEKANEDAFTAIREATVPVVAKVRGFCLGGGFGLAAAADIRIAAVSARFAVPAARLGLGYPMTAMSDIVTAIGAQNTKRMLFTAERFQAGQMLDMGFLAEILEDDDLDQRAEELARKIADLAPLTHRATKAAIDAALGGDLSKAEELGSATFTSADYAEGRAAFREKREPKFTGK